jgi:hypothetical protein
MTQISNTEGVAPLPDNSPCQTHPNNEMPTQRRSAAGKWAMPEEGPPIGPKGSASRARARQRLSLPEVLSASKLSSHAILYTAVYKIYDQTVISFPPTAPCTCFLNTSHQRFFSNWESAWQRAPCQWEGQHPRLTQISNTVGVAPLPYNSPCQTHPNNEMPTQRRSAAGKWAMPTEARGSAKEAHHQWPEGRSEQGRARQRLSLPEVHGSDEAI